MSRYPSYSGGKCQLIDLRRVAGIYLWCADLVELQHRRKPDSISLRWLQGYTWTNYQFQASEG